MGSFPVSAPRTRSACAEEAVAALRQAGAGQPSRTVRVVTDLVDASPVTLPRAAVTALMTALSHLSRGDDVAVLPLRQDLSSQEAAVFLKVSRPFLVRLLDEGRIPHRKVGRKRRVLLEDLRAYQRQTQVGLRAAAPSGGRAHRRRGAAGA